MDKLFLKQQTHKRGGRINELACLYYISNITEQPDISIEEAFSAVVEILPPSWQYPDIAYGRIVFDNHEYTTKAFEKTSWHIESEICIDGAIRGFVEVSYSEERPELEEGPFLKEESDLIDDIALKLSRFIIFRERHEQIQSCEKMYRHLVERLAVSILILEESHVLYANEAMLHLVGAKNKIELIGCEAAEFVHADSREQFQQLFQLKVRPEKWSPEVELELIRLDDFRVIEVAITTIKIDSGKKSQFQLVLHDIHDRKEIDTQRLYDRLSKRERQIMEMVVNGETSKIIALHLGVSRKTVENHRANLNKKMESFTLAGLIRKSRLIANK